MEIEEIDKLRNHLVSKLNTIDSGYPKTNTKKFNYWCGFSDAIVALDNYVLQLKKELEVNL